MFRYYAIIIVTSNLYAKANDNVKEILALRVDMGRGLLDTVTSHQWFSSKNLPADLGLVRQIPNVRVVLYYQR